MKLRKLLAAVCFVTVLSIPVTGVGIVCGEKVTAAERTEEVCTIMSANIVWKYKVENGRHYKRAYNTVTQKYVTGWILME